MNDDHQRSGDILIAELKVKFDDFLKRYEENHSESKVWRSSVDVRLSTLERFHEALNGPWKATLFIISAMTLAAVTHFSSHIFRVVKRICTGD